MIGVLIVFYCDDFKIIWKTLLLVCFIVFLDIGMLYSKGVHNYEESVWSQMMIILGSFFILMTLIFGTMNSKNEY